MSFNGSAGSDRPMQTSPDIVSSIKDNRSQWNCMKDQWFEVVLDAKKIVVSLRNGNTAISLSTGFYLHIGINSFFKMSYEGMVYFSC